MFLCVYECVCALAGMSVSACVCLRFSAQVCVCVCVLVYVFVCVCFGGLVESGCVGGCLWGLEHVSVVLPG